MLFNSVQFLIFFPVVTTLYFLIPHKYRWALLLSASCVFYTYFIPKYILILAVTILIDYPCGILIENSSGFRKKALLLISVLSTCLVLFIFKYFNFFVGSYNQIAAVLGLEYSFPILNIILPIGLSFHTFQSLSYVIEVYKGRQKAERHFGIYALYVMFYPQLVAGPIERPQNLIHQFREIHVPDPDRISNGLKLMLWGLFKKVVIADRLAFFVGNVYDAPAQWNGISFVLATVFFAFQIYCDFSGYSDIAIGSAQVMGFRLMDNFNRPYFSKSVPEFWKRWHISLSTWFRDYMYIPLGGNKCSVKRLYFNLFVTFLVSGLWHGANWTYVIWGALNGLYLLGSHFTAGLRYKLSVFIGIASYPTIHKLWKITVTFGLICFSWIFFRAQSIQDAGLIVARIFNVSVLNAMSDAGALKRAVFMGCSARDFALAVLSICFLLGIHFLQRHRRIRSMLTEYHPMVRWTLTYLFVMGILLFGATNTAQKFIYFQF